jgi:hypothetical protein
MLGSRAFVAAVAVVAAIGLSLGEGTASARRHRLGPTVMMFYGGALKAPVTVSGQDVDAFGDFMRKSTVTVADLGTRPFMNVALFWGSLRDPANNGTPIARLTPEMAWQHGRFYPPSGAQPAVLLTTQFTKAAQPVPVPSSGSAFVGGGVVPDTALPLLRKLGLVPMTGPAAPQP